MESIASGFNPGSYQDLPLYNIQAVSAASGIPTITLRAWERRYGIPSPARDAKGYRLYSERDIAMVRWLKERVQHGVSIGRAVNVLNALQRGEIIPETTGTLDVSSLTDRLLDAVTRFDEAGISRAVNDALTVTTVEETCESLIQPALRAIGERWAEGELSPTHEHFASNILRGHLVQLARLSPAPHRTESVLIGCAPGEEHDIGALMVALFLRRRGFHVLYLGASVEADSYIRDVRRLAPAAACLSAATRDSAQELARLYRGLRPVHDGILAFGGWAFVGEPALADTVDGLYLGPDVSTAAQRLGELLAGSADEGV
jgi:methanogenic corrinoid protein MtbC1